MSLKIWIPILVLALFAAAAIFITPCTGGEVPLTSGYKVLPPIRHGNLTVFPVAAASSHNTQSFLTLDEGLRSGEVIVTEGGNVQPLMRRRNRPVTHDEAQVNRLVLVNNSKRPLILLAGEIVTGGKQDRVIGKDRLVPAESDPIDLGVFCVEPGRWTATSAKFDLTLVAEEEPAGIRLAFEYSTELFAPETIKRMLGHLENLLEVIVIEGDETPRAKEIAARHPWISYLFVYQRGPFNKSLLLNRALRSAGEVGGWNG